MASTAATEHCRNRGFPPRTYQDRSQHERDQEQNGEIDRLREGRGSGEHRADEEIGEAFRAPRPDKEKHLPGTEESEQGIIRKENL